MITADFCQNCYDTFIEDHSEELRETVIIKNYSQKDDKKKD